MPYEYSYELLDAATGERLFSDGWFRVTSAGAPASVAITDLDDNSVSTYTKAIADGAVSFRTAETVLSVDIFGFTSDGYAFQLLAQKPGANCVIAIDRGRLDQTIIIPFDVGEDSDVTANTEADTGIELPDNFIVMPTGIGVKVTEADSGITIDVGVDSTSGIDDPDGLLDGVSVAATGLVLGTVGFDVGSNAAFVDLTGGDQEFTYGVLLCGTGTKVALAEGSDTDTDEGFYLIEPHIADGSAAANIETITFTPAASADTAAGYIIIPGRLPFPA